MTTTRPDGSLPGCTAQVETHGPSVPTQQNLQTAVLGRSILNIFGVRVTTEQAAATEMAPLLVFLSYAREDREAAETLYEWLKSEGFRPWMDVAEILPGHDWNREISKAVRRSDVILVCLTPTSTTKESYFQRELKKILEASLDKPLGTIFLIPIVVVDCEVPDEFRAYQYVRLAESDWPERLREALRARAAFLGRTRLEPESFDGLISRVRRAFLQTSSPFELRSLLYELDEALERYPHHPKRPEARMLRDQIVNALPRMAAGRDLILGRPIPSATTSRRAPFLGISAAVLNLLVGLFIIKGPSETIRSKKAAAQSAIDRVLGRQPAPNNRINFIFPINQAGPRAGVPFLFRGTVASNATNTYIYVLHRPVGASSWFVDRAVRSENSWYLEESGGDMIRVPGTVELMAVETKSQLGDPVSTEDISRLAINASATIRISVMP